jgi:hypothetical protein
MKNELKFLGIIALVAITGFSMTACASQAEPVDTTFSETVNVTGVSADDLFDRANLWFADTFQGPEIEFTVPYTIPEKSRILAANKNNGTIQANYALLTESNDAPGVYQIWQINSTVVLQVSEGQYSLTFSNPVNFAHSYIKQNRNWVVSTKGPLFKKYVEVTRNVWNDLASALKETVGGTLVGN